MPIEDKIAIHVTEVRLKGFNVDGNWCESTLKPFFAILLLMQDFKSCDLVTPEK